ncbi:uncharacterized protein [Rutidosis leptorrhynchoides]|uniref:uncharacterized protein n=1 Tax=Rutidosis leptorrhynchoides TaxID=125765 RepID=UPI003A9914D5
MKKKGNNGWRPGKSGYFGIGLKGYNKNNIRGLSTNGAWCENPIDIKEAAYKHFKDRFEERTTSRPSLAELSYPNLSSEEARGLEAPISEEEIIDAIHDCGCSKAPGPDGFNMRFFKKFWDIIKVDVVNAITWFWKNGEFSKGCNASFVTLVPKKSDPITINDFRPISLIGSFYKIVAKILSNRLRKVIPRLIGSEQSAFLKDRYILDGILVANESIDFLKKAQKKRIRACLNSASISILINGSPTREFSMGRGVRQGDPLSPFLFILAAEGLNILTKAAVDRGLFKGVEIGRDKVVVSHLQYADDTMFLGDWVDSDDVESLAKRMGCQADNSPFMYLGLPIGARMKKVGDWYPMIEKFKNRLSEWKMRTLSFGGRLVLLKSVLNSLPFGDLEGSKILWVNWEATCLPYGVGGLNIGSLKSKNLALLGKWWWRFKIETNCFWVKIIRSIYGIDGGLRLSDGLAHRSAKSIWQNIIWAGNIIEDFCIPFRSSFKKSIGDGSSTSFWNDNWCGSDCLKTLFPRLFKLESDINACISNQVQVANNHLRSAAGGPSTPLMPPGLSASACTAFDTPSGARTVPVTAGSSANNLPAGPSDRAENMPDLANNVSFRFNWAWLRVPSGRTWNELQELENLLRSISFNFNSQEAWKWSLANNGEFTVKKLSSLLDARILGNPYSTSHKTLRNNLVPKKVEIFVWRALRMRIPVRLELDKRGIDLHSVRCPVCDDNLESVDHALVSCRLASDVWNRVYKWWNLGSCSLSCVSESLQGRTSHSVSFLGKKNWQAVEWICVYYIWKNRNLEVFHKKASIVPVLVNEIQVKSFEWISCRLKGNKIEWLSWLSNPSLYLSL